MKTIQLQVAVTLGDDATKLMVELLTQALKPPVSQPSGDIDEKREARLRASRNALFAGQKPPNDMGLLIASREAARLLKVSPRTVWAMQNDGRMPPPIKIGKAVRWSYEALKKWVELGCPRQKSLH
jgi:excisionase family DNA binding protein